MSSFTDELKTQLKSEVRFDTASKVIYSVDASIFEVEPIAICFPKSADDIIIAVEIARRHKVPVIARGAGTGIAGGCLGPGLIIDTSKYLTKVLSIDPEKKIAVVEPGVIQDDLNSQASAFGLRLGPDTSTGNRATIGGMVSTNAAGAHSLKYGRMVDHVEEIELVLSSGDIINTKPLDHLQFQQKSSLPTQEGVIYREIANIRNQYSSYITKEFPKIVRRASGYNLNYLTDPHWNNLSQLIVGSEGTFGVITKITLRLSEVPRKRSLILAAYDSMMAALDDTEFFLDMKPFALELIDDKIIDAGKSSPSMQGKLSWLKGNPKALIVIEFEGDEKRAAGYLESIKVRDHVIWSRFTEDEALMQQVWALRKSGLGLLLSKRGYLRAIAFIEDVAVPYKKLRSFTEELINLLQSAGKEAGIYGHIGEGCLHIRPYIDLLSSSDKDTMQRLLIEVADLVQRYGGTLSAEHGDGYIRSHLTEKVFGKKLTQAFGELKRAFDPNNLMNPGKIVGGSNPFSLLRKTPTTTISTFFDFGNQGGFELAADLCNGNGECRKSSGVMCPSFQATHDEKDSTRARAQALRALIHERVTKEDITSPDFYPVFDLCIQCKGCKKECPSQVDMAKMKSEYLYWYHSKHGYSARSYLFGFIGKLFCIGSITPKLTNFILSLLTPFLPFIGVTSKKKLPTLSKNRFSTTTDRSSTLHSPVVLISDTFTEFTNSTLGFQAVRLLEAAGYSVIIPAWSCCGRTLISKGFLPEAKQYAEKLLAILYPFAEKKIPITCLEPSCLATLQDEYLSFGLGKKAEKVALSVRSIEELLFDKKETLASFIKPNGKPIYIHTHCHEKALCDRPVSADLLRHLFQAKVVQLQTGCCGMAGSFGYESEHLAISESIAHHTLLPHLKNLEKNAILLSNGTSCRHQIAETAGREAYHIVTYLHTEMGIF